MPPINPNALPPRRPIQFENHTPESFGRNGFVNTTPASQAPNSHQAPVDPDFINTTARDYRPQLHIDTGVANHRPVDRATQGSESPLSDPDRTITAFSDQSGRHAPMHPGMNGGSSGYPASRASNGSESPLQPFSWQTPPAPSTLPSLTSSPTLGSPSPLYSPRAVVGDDARILNPESPSQMITRSPSPEIPESPARFHELIPLSRAPSPPYRAATESPGPAWSDHSGTTTVPNTPRNAPTPGGQSMPSTESPGGYGYAPTPGAYLSSPGSYGYAPTPQAYRSPTPLSNPPTPGYAPTPGGWVSPTPGVEEGAQNLMRLHDSSGHSGASTPRPPATP